MKRWLCLALAALILCGCTEPAAPLRGAQQSMKGWELYSWQEAGTWQFTLVPGTNRLKTWDEITQEGVAGVVTLKARLATLAEGEQVFWGTELAGGALPPEAIVDQVREYCKTLGLSLVLLP
ncbi:MAG: hypothetical protein JXB35_03475 [Anaerolineae bacterium]|nr:hypothetical protein [Anaerolineae bacterium]